MRRVERKLFKINDEIAALREAERLAGEELSYHRHLADDAERDAAVSESPFDRADARETSADVARFEAHVDMLQQKRLRLEGDRARLLRNLKIEH